MELEDIEYKDEAIRITKTNEDGTFEFTNRFEPLSLYIRIGDKLDYIVVEGYSMLELITEIGGLASFVYGISRILSREVARSWLIGSLSKELFRSKETKDSKLTKNELKIAREEQTQKE